MRLAFARFRTYVHATEDEARVRDALLWVMGILGEPRAESRVDRKRFKGHHGNEILLLEAGLKSPADVAASLDRLLADAGFRHELAEGLAAHLDEEHVLHLRLDKQAAVQRALRTSSSGDAVVALYKGVAEPDENPVTAWARRIREPAAPA